MNEWYWKYYNRNLSSVTSRYPSIQLTKTICKVHALSYFAFGLDRLYFVTGDKDELRYLNQTAQTMMNDLVNVEC